MEIEEAIKKKKKAKYSKKDEENILSKDIDLEEEMKDIEKITENKGVKTREINTINMASSYIKNLKFRPIKYKGNVLPYHLRWIFNSSIVI